MVIAIDWNLITNKLKKFKMLKLIINISKSSIEIKNFVKLRIILIISD